MTGTVYRCHALHFRAGPGMTEKIIGYLHPGDKVNIIGTSGAFYNVVFNGKTGWAGSKYVKAMEETPPPAPGAFTDYKLTKACYTVYAVAKKFGVPQASVTRVDGRPLDPYAMRVGSVVRVRLDGAAATPDVPGKPVEYKQGDSRWARHPYTSCGNKSQTIKSSGCGIVCAAMIIASWIDRKVTPPDMAKLAVDNGYRTRNSGTAWAFFPFLAKKYGLKCAQYSGKYGFDPAIQALRKGALVVCSMGKGYFTACGHYILAWTEDGKNIVVNNPGSGSSKNKGAYDVFRKECRAYFIFTK